MATTTLKISNRASCLFFRYHKDVQDGCFRVQTVRFESEELVSAELFQPEDGTANGDDISNPDDPADYEDADMDEICSSVGGSTSVRSEAFDVCSSVGGSTSVRSEAFEGPSMSAFNLDSSTTTTTTITPDLQTL